MGWSLFNEKGEFLQPKAFSDGKTQEDVVNKVVSEIRNGTKIIFIHGVCGSGKSAIALNIGRELGRASIVVPIKNLQRQYEKDYMHQKYLLKKNKKNEDEKLKISVITGRRNHKCPYLEDSKKEILLTRIKQEKNSNLFDIFSSAKKDFASDKVEKDDSCDSFLIPCKIEIKAKNLSTLKKYYFENPERGENKDLDIKTAKRFAVAPACPFWSPIMPSEKKIHGAWEKKEYDAVNGKYSLYSKKEGCPYYSQFNAYKDSDIIIFNSDQYILETALGRKPLTDVEIIDECDEFLDSFAVEETINLTRLRNELGSIIPSDENKKLVDGLSEDVTEVLNECRDKLDKDSILELEKTEAKNLIRALVKSDILDVMGEESYLEHCLEVSRKFYELIEDSYVSFYKDKNGKNDIFMKIVTVNLDKLLGALISKNKAFVFMSGTLHSEKVLKEIFGLKDFKIVEAEVFNQGTIRKLKTGLEKDFKFENFTKNLVTREGYLKALDKCIEIAKIPIVVQVSAFSDLPSQSELEKFSLKNLISFSELMEMQNNDKEGKLILDFKAGKTKILFTTRCNRGIDFPFETCNSVVITKFPYPNTQSLFWKILSRNKPDFFWDFYKDKAHRELLQRVYRSVRAPNDSVFLLSPDIRVLNTNIFK